MFYHNDFRFTVMTVVVPDLVSGPERRNFKCAKSAFDRSLNGSYSEFQGKHFVFSIKLRFN